MSDGHAKARRFLVDERRRVEGQVRPSYAEYGIVSAVSGNLVAVRRTRDTDDSTALLARAAGPKLSIGDNVALIPVRGGGSVAVKIGGQELVQLSGDTMTGDLNIANGNDIFGYSDNLVTQTFRLRADTGQGEFARGVTYNGVAPQGGSVQSGRMVYLRNTYPLGTLAGIALTANRLYYVPVFIPTTITCDAFIFEITNAVSGSIQCGLYTMISSFLPGSLVLLGTKTAQSTIGIKVQTHTGASVPGGIWYFLGICSTTAMSIMGSTTKANFPSPRGGIDSSSNHFLMAFEDLSGGWTNLPSTASGGSISNLYLDVGARNA